MPSAASYPTAKCATDAAFSSEPPSLSGRAADLPPSAYGSALRQRVRARCPILEEGAPPGQIPPAVRSFNPSALSWPRPRLPPLLACRAHCRPPHQRSSAFAKSEVQKSTGGEIDSSAARGQIVNHFLKQLPLSFIK